MRRRCILVLSAAMIYCLSVKLIRNRHHRIFFLDITEACFDVNWPRLDLIPTALASRPGAGIAGLSCAATIHVRFSFL